MPEAQTEMAKAMARQASELERIIADWEPVEAGAARIEGRRVFLVGTGTSWHAANQGAYFLRLAGAEAWPVSAAGSALWGPRPTPADALVLLSHRGTKRYTAEVLKRAQAEGVPTVAIGGQRAPGVDIETVAQEKAGTYTVSHLGALARLAQLAVRLGAELGALESVPTAVADALEQPSESVGLPERGLEFVGAGPNGWTAAEGALKVREAAHVFAEGLETEQVLHGPAWALDCRDAVICLDGGGPGAARLAELVDTIEIRGTRVHRFAAPELGEALSVFALTATVQRIALAFARELGTDPDDVRPGEWKAIEL